MTTALQLLMMLEWRDIAHIRNAFGPGNFFGIKPTALAEMPDVVGGACVGPLSPTASILYAGTFARSLAVSALPGLEGPLPAALVAPWSGCELGTCGWPGVGPAWSLSSSGRSLSWCLVVPLSFSHVSFFGSWSQSVKGTLFLVCLARCGKLASRQGHNHMDTNEALCWAVVF